MKHMKLFNESWAFKKEFIFENPYNYSPQSTSNEYIDTEINGIKYRINSDSTEEIIDTIQRMEVKFDNPRFDIYFINILDYQFTKRYNIFMVDYLNQDAQIDIVYSYDTDGLTATHYYGVQREGVTLFNNNDIDIKEVIEGDGVLNLLERMLNVFHDLTKD